MSRFSRSIELFKSSWAVIRSDTELLVLPAMSAVVSVFVMATFAAPAFFSMTESTTVDAVTGATTESLQPTLITYVVAALFYFVSAFVVVFFNAALIHGANQRFEGGNPTLKSALSGAWSRKGLIAQWAAVSATVSLIIRQIQENAGIFGKILGGLLGFAWGVVTYLVLPTLVIEGVSVKDGFKRSGETIKQTWGENVMGQGGIGLLGFLMVLPGLALVVAGLLLGQAMSAVGIALIVIGVLAVLAAILLSSGLSVVYQTALYRFATGRAVPGFDPAVLRAAYGPRKGRRSV